MFYTIYLEPPKMGFLGYCVTMLSKMIKLTVKIIVYLFVRWVIAMILSLILHSFIHYYIFPAPQSHSYPVHLTYDPCHPKQTDKVTNSVRCSFLYASVDLQGPRKINILQQGLAYSFEVILELPEELNDNLGMFVVCLELLDETGESTINIWKERLAPRYQAKGPTDISNNCKDSEENCYTEVQNQCCRSTMLLSSQKTILSHAEYFKILADPFAIFRTTKPANEEHLPSVSVTMSGELKNEPQKTVAWARIIVKHPHINVYSARLSITTEFAGFQYLISLSPLVTGVTWVIINGICIFSLLCAANIPSLLNVNDKAFLRDFFSLSRSRDN